MSCKASWARMTGFVLVAMAVLVLGACQKEQVEKDYARELPAGAQGLRKLDRSEWPDWVVAVRKGDAALITALGRSADWFALPSSKQFFPMSGMTHRQSRASVLALRDFLTTSKTMGDFAQKFQEQFDIYTSVGWNGQGEVLFTGYYSPVVHASKTQTAEYRYPLYQRPSDLVSDPATGIVKGRQINGHIEPYPARDVIESSHMLQGQELVWMKDAMDCYIVQIQGSAKLIMTDGSEMLIGYAGNNGHEYTSIGKLLVADGKINKNTLSLPVLRRYFQEHPQELSQYTRRNERFVFFKPYAANNWPAGSLGFEVTSMRTLATDKSVFPRGLPLLVMTQVPEGAGNVLQDEIATEASAKPSTVGQPFEQLMVDQDTGGAIRAPGRADIYMGTGKQAEQIAGRQLYEGRLYYLILKPQFVDQWLPKAEAAGH